MEEIDFYENVNEINHQFNWFHLIDEKEEDLGDGIIFLWEREEFKIWIFWVYKNKNDISILIFHSYKKFSKFIELIIFKKSTNDDGILFFINLILNFKSTP